MTWQCDQRSSQGRKKQALGEGPARPQDTLPEDLESGQSSHSLDRGPSVQGMVWLYRFQGETNQLGY